MTKELFLGVLILGVVYSIVLGCGGTDADEDGWVIEDTVTGNPESFVLTLDDLPEAWSVMPDVSDETGPFADEYRKTSGCTVEFERDWAIDGRYALYSSVAVFETVKYAHRLLDDFPKAVDAVDILPAPTIGDKAYGWKVAKSGEQVEGTCFHVTFRKQNVVGMVGLCGLEDSASLDDALRFGRIMESRIE